jgi:hypothetical protein
MKKAILALTISLTLFIFACEDNSPAPEEVAEKYIKASLIFDFETLKQVIVKESIGEIDKAADELKAMFSKSGSQSSQIQARSDALRAVVPKAEPAKISKDKKSASVMVNLLDQNGDKLFMIIGTVLNSPTNVNLIKEDGKWKVKDISDSLF